jgi:hypothetical protein
LTGTWGDANCGGTFGPHLKFDGYDGILFRGIADTPVYLFIDDGMPQLRDADFLWGRDTNETEDVLKDTDSIDRQIAALLRHETQVPGFNVPPGETTGEWVNRHVPELGTDYGFTYGAVFRRPIARR